MENVASMDISDQNHMSNSFGGEPLYIDAAGVSLAHRPRLYWVDWEVFPSSDAERSVTSVGRTAVQLQSVLEEQDYLLPGWTKVSDRKFPTFATSRPRATGGYKPAGLKPNIMRSKGGWMMITDSRRINIRMCIA